MSLKVALLSLAPVVCTHSAVSEEITAEQSGAAVEAWMKKYRTITGKGVLRTETITNAITGARFHVAMLRGGGFVATSADDRVSPVMAYSDTGTFVNDSGNPLLQILLSDAAAAKEAFDEEGQVSSSGRKNAQLSAASSTCATQERTEAQNEWDELLGRTSARSGGKTMSLSTSATEPTESTTSIAETRVKPLLRDRSTGRELRWGQLTHNDDKDFGDGSGLLCYNYYCPEWPAETGSAGSGSDAGDARPSTHYPCGCVATAGAMIMKKWEHPGRFSFSDMPANPARRSTTAGRKAIGEITREIGEVCNATYGIETSMFSDDMVEGLVNCFSYSGAFWQWTQDSDFTASDGGICNFDKQVLPNLIAGCPVSMNLVGHSVVVDGLRFDGAARKIHVNFGWLVESANTWYVPQTFRVSYKAYEDGRLVSKTKTYSSVKGIGINIHPEKRKAIIAGRVACNRPGESASVGLKGASVALKRSGSSTVYATSDAYGQFFFLVDGGTYRLEASKAGHETRTVNNVTVGCSGKTVSNYYTEISLQGTGTAPVATPEAFAVSCNSDECYAIEMSCATDGATIRYSTDGSDPTEDDAVYSGTFVQHGQDAMTIRARAFKEGLVPSGVCSLPLLFRPASGNSKFCAPVAINSAEGRTSMNNSTAARESGEPAHSVMGKDGGSSMWASFDPPEDGDYTFTASGVSADNGDLALDTQLAVYTGNSVNSLTLVAANDDVDAASYDLSSMVAFHAVKGTTYRIAVDTRNGARGTVNLEWKRGREDVASPVEYNLYYTAENNTYSIAVRSTAAWHVCDGSDWIKVKKSSGGDGECLTFELPEMTADRTRSGVLMVCAGEDGPSSAIRITQGTTSWVTSRADALAQAKTVGKRILMVCGRDTSYNTTYTRFYACEDDSVKPLLLEDCILWYCDCDEQMPDYSYYVAGLGSGSLPLVCIIDPGRPEEYVARSTGQLTAAQLRQLLEENSEGDLPTAPFEVSATGDDAAGAIAISYSKARRAQSYEIWRGTKWNPADSVRIASDVRSEEYVDDSAEPAVLYYYRVRAVNGAGAGELSAPATACWRGSGASGDPAIGIALGAPHLDWTTEGDYPWTAQETNTYDGAGAMQSAFVPPAPGKISSVMKTTVTGPTRMSFRYKTRIYASRFTVKVNGVEMFLVTGAVDDWTIAEVEIPEGENEVVFSYEKNGYYTSGFNGVYLDAVQFDVLSRSPVLTPATTDDEDTALAFTGSMEVSIAAPDGGVIHYTIDGSEPTSLSPVYEGPFSISASTRVRTICVQDGYAGSAEASGLYLERHPVQAGEWTTDVDGAKKAALKDGSIIVTLLTDYDNNERTRSFAAVSESAEFLSWARENGVYLVTADSSRWAATDYAYNRFWDLYRSAGLSGTAYYPSLAIASAWEPDAATGYALAWPGQSIGGVQYGGTVSSLEAGLASFFGTRPSNAYVLIEFDGNGGTPDKKSVVGIAGQPVELPSARRDSHSFNGWYTSLDATGVKVTSGIAPDSDTVYHARWTPNKYLVSFDANGGNVSPNHKYVDYGTEYGDLPTPHLADSSDSRVFDGWYTAANGGARITSATKALITSPQTLYAHWKTLSWSSTVTYSPGLYGEGTSQTATKDVNVLLTLEGAIFTRIGHTQTGWSRDIRGNTRDYALYEVYADDADVCLYPFWSADAYTMTFDANGGSGDKSVAQEYGTPLVAPTVTRTGYTLTGWSPEVEKTVPASNATFTAQWRINRYTVAFNANGGEGGAAYELDYDAEISVPEVSRDGHLFVGWSPEVAAKVPASNVTYTAQWWISRYMLQFDPNGGAGWMDDQTLERGTSTPLDACAFSRAGYWFVGWALSAAGDVVYGDGESLDDVYGQTGPDIVLYAVWKSIAAKTCEEAFGGSATVSEDGAWNTVVTLTNDVSGTVEIPDNVGSVTIDLNGHDIVGQGGRAAIRIVAGGGDGTATSLAIDDSSDGDKGKVAGDGDAAGIEVADDAAAGVHLDVDEDVSVLNGDGSEQDRRGLSPVENTLKAGESFSATLAELGYNVPTDGQTAYKVVALGLPAGLKLVSNKAQTAKVKKNGKTTTVVVKPANVEWWIEGVPTAALDYATNPAYLVITANGRTETLPLDLEVLAQDVTELDDLALGETLNEQFYLPGVTNGWTVTGLPTGLNYTPKLVTTKKTAGKKTVVTTNALPYSVYGKTTKAGLFTVTAKKKVGAYYETLKFRLLVTPAAVDATLFGEGLTNITTMAHVPIYWDLTGSGTIDASALPEAVTPAPFAPSATGMKVAKATGLPTGLAFATADVYGYKNAKKKTGKYVKQKGQTIKGTPSKPGTYVVTFTKNVTTGTGKNKKTVAKTAQILWNVVANDAPLALGFNRSGGIVESGVVGLKYDGLFAFTATSNATVTASGVPKGINLVRLAEADGGSAATPSATWGFVGFTTQTGTYLVTVTATLNGNTVTQRIALNVEGLPTWAKGTFNGATAAAWSHASLPGYGEAGLDDPVAPAGLATITVSSVGAISGKFAELGTNWTLSAASFTARADGGASPADTQQTGGPGLGSTDAFTCTNVVAKYSYKVTEKVKGKKKTVTKTLARTFTLTIAPAPVVPDATDAAVRGVATMAERNDETTATYQDATEIVAWQNLWGRSDYKTAGAKLFTTRSGKKTLAYKTFTVNVCANDAGAFYFKDGYGIVRDGNGTPWEGDDTTELANFAALSLKVTTAGALTATMTYDTGKTTKDSKSKKMVKVYYKPTCSTVVIPTSAAASNPFTSVAYLYFAPSAANNFPGFAGWMPVTSAP